MEYFCLGAEYMSEVYKNDHKIIIIEPSERVFNYLHSSTRFT